MALFILSQIHSEQIMESELLILDFFVIYISTIWIK